MTDNWAVILVFSGIALSIPLIGLVGAFILRPKKPGAIKQTIYECGLETIGETWVQFKVQYYLYALIFVLFDVETDSLYRWAVAYSKLPMFALFEMLVFLLILGLGLVYAWRKGVLEWS